MFIRLKVYKVTKTENLINFMNLIHFMNSLTISSPSDADQRIDKFLRKYLPNAPLGGIFKWLRTGKVKVNGKKVEQNHRVLLGDVIDLYFSDEEIKEMRYKR
jgi:23S rRNA-/tRNA-specific pseudouridylate synthase